MQLKYNLSLLFSSLFVVAFSVTLSGQKTWIEPSGADFDPKDSVRIYVDITQCDCQRLLGNEGPLFLWTWKPTDSDRPVPNGQWTSSNEAMAMRNEGGDIWSFGMIPTEFYNTTANTIYNEGFAFLVKAKDGTGAGGGGCDEDKTEDLELTVTRPGGTRKVYSLPDYIGAVADTLLIGPDDFFTLFYDNKLEEKSTLLSLESDDQLFVFAKARGDNEQEYTLTSPAILGTDPSVQMRNNGNGIYTWTIVPSQLFAEKIPDGVTVAQLRLQIANVDAENPAATADRVVDGLFIFNLRGCD